MGSTRCASIVYPQARPPLRTQALVAKVDMIASLQRNGIRAAMADHVSPSKEAQSPQTPLHI